MRGQLWQECFCGTEPVCAVCEKCERHCDCPSPEELAEIREEQKRAQIIDAGIELIANYVKNFATRVDGADGETICDTRKFYPGAGHGVGDVYRIDDDETIYLSHYTASDVDEWAWCHYKLTNCDEGFGNGNLDIVKALSQLTSGTPLTDSQAKAFKVV